MDESSKASQALSEIMLKSLSKDPALAAKQRRLLEKLKNDSNSEPPSDSSHSKPDETQKKDKLPDAPSRDQFESQEDFEEARGRWQETVDRTRGMAEVARRTQRKQAIRITGAIDRKFINTTATRYALKSFNDEYLPTG